MGIDNSHVDSPVYREAVGSGIVKVVMQDRVNKNTFSPALVSGMQAMFTDLNGDKSCKVVILTGYDSYFSSGGTLNGLRDLYQGKSRFTDSDLYSLALNCPVPVISAMQGHGIGGGFVLGMFADFPILSLESIYTTNFMKYGFTPGMGSTLILPYRLGPCLSQEMMLSAKNYRGIDLKQRGVPFPVVPRNSVVSHAVNLAESIADKPRESLVTLKKHLISEVKEKLARAIEDEIKMHEQTIHSPEVKQRVETTFGQ